jgi:hypothetical protein
MSGYALGPTLAHDQRPWPILWEQQVDETCAHQWERVLLLAGSQRYRQEPVIRCSLCHVPRCGDSDEVDPCMERRHHRSLHLRLSGAWAPLGGLPDAFVDYGDLR